MSPVECHGAVILRVYDKQRQADLVNLRTPSHGIDKENLIQTLAVKASVHSQPPKQHGWNDRVSRQRSAYVGWKIGEQDASRT